MCLRRIFETIALLTAPFPGFDLYKAPSEPVSQKKRKKRENKKESVYYYKYLIF